MPRIRRPERKLGFKPREDVHMKKLTDFVTFNDQVMAKKYSDGRSKIPMSDLFEGYFDGKIDLKVDVN